MKPRPFSMRLLAGIAASFAVSLSGCSTPTVIRLHSLLSTTTAPVAGVGTATLLIDLAQVSVPAAVDQPQWLVRAVDDSLRLLEQERWASSPRDELRAALAERLAQGFGAVDVRTLAAGSPQAAGPVWRVRVDVQRFESIPGREAWLDSSWSVQASGSGAAAAPASSSRASSALACRSSLRESAVGDLPALAEAHRRAVTRLAAQIGTRLTALSRGQSAACGTPDGP